MDQGAIDVDEFDGSFDLQSTVESGQSYLWRRADDRMYERTAAHGGDAWYYTVLPAAATATNEPEVIRVRQTEGQLVWYASTPNAYARLKALLRLDDDLGAIVTGAPDDELVERAFDAYRGMRLVRDPPFGSLISFICSAQMRVSRIHGMQTRLARTYGDAVTFDGETYHAYPTPEQLAAATEADLRELSLGYRAPYVQRTAEMIASGAAEVDSARGRPYEEARERLTEFVGVGRKVADCVLLFSLDYLQAVPLDTWIRGAIADRFPDCDRGGYVETSRAIRERFGNTYAGYVQTYVFHYLRSGNSVPRTEG